MANFVEGVHLHVPGVGGVADTDRVIDQQGWDVELLHHLEQTVLAVVPHTVDSRVGQDLDHQGRLSSGVVGVVFEIYIAEVPNSLHVVEYSDVVPFHAGF